MSQRILERREFILDGLGDGDGVAIVGFGNGDADTGLAVGARDRSRRSESLLDRRDLTERDGRGLDRRRLRPGGKWRGAAGSRCGRRCVVQTHPPPGS